MFADSPAKKESWKVIEFLSSNKQNLEWAKVVGVLPPGRHTLSTQNIPFLNSIVNSFTGGQVFISEIFFVKTSPVLEESLT